jgi:hypothetical protein
MADKNELKLWYSVNLIKKIARSVSLILGILGNLVHFRYSLIVLLAWMRLDFLQHLSGRRHHPRSHRKVGEVFGDQFIVVGYHPSPVHHKVGRFHRIFDGSGETSEFLAVR